jgi:tetratricopeptide (TPR) repeat protein
MKKMLALLLTLSAALGAAEPSLADRAASLDRVLRLRESFQSNSLIVRDFKAHSNADWAAPRTRALQETNTALADMLVSLTNILGGDPAQTSEILLLAAEQLFLEAPSSRRNDAFVLYEQILRLDQAMLKESRLENWEGRRTPLSVDAFDRALLMDRYRLQVGPAFGEGASEEARWKAFYRSYHPYYTNGYVPTAEFRINMGVFYLFEGDLKRAHTALQINRFSDEDFWVDRLKAAEFLAAGDDTARWARLQRYLQENRLRDSLQTAPGSGQIQLAVAWLTRRDALGQDRIPTLEEMPTDETVLERSLEHLEQACRDPLAVGPARFNQGLIYLALERWPNAVMALEDSLRHWPDARVYYALGLAELRLQNNPRAYRWFEELNRVSPNLGQQDSLFLNNFVCAGIGDTNLEVRRLSLSRIARAVELDDRNPVIQLTRGELLASTGDLSGATNQFRRALSMAQAINPETYTNAMPWFRLRETNRVPQRIEELRRRAEKLLGMGPR